MIVTVTICPISLSFLITDFFFFIYIFVVFCSFLAALLKRPRTPPANNSAVDYQTADSDHALKRPRAFGISNEVLHNNSFVFSVDLVEV